MQKLMLGFAGEMDTGKGTAANVVIGWYPETKSFRFSDSLREFYVLFLAHIREFPERDVGEELLPIEHIVRRAFGARVVTRGIGSGIPLVRFSQWLGSEFVPAHRGVWNDTASTPDLQAISTAVRSIFGEDTLERAIMSRVNCSGGDSPVVIIEGIRRLVDIGSFLGDPSTPFRLTYLKADPFVRYKRHVIRNEKPGDKDLTYEQFLALGEQEAERQIRLLEPHAHLVIDNTYAPVFPAEQLRRALDTWFGEIK